MSERVCGAAECRRSGLFVDNDALRWLCIEIYKDKTVATLTENITIPPGAAIVVSCGASGIK